MSRIALYNGAGRCLGIFSDNQDLSVLDYAYSAPVGETARPNTTGINTATGQATVIAYTPVRVSTSDTTGPPPSDGGGGIEPRDDLIPQ